MQRAHIFRKIYTAESLTLARKFFFWEDGKKKTALYNPKPFLKGLFPCDIEYSQIFFANIDGFSSLIFRLCVVRKFCTKFSYYEDGWSSYILDLSKYSYSAYEQSFYESQGQPILQKGIHEIWLYDIRLYCQKKILPLRSIPKVDINDAQFKDIINTTFSYQKCDEYSCRHIFLEEAFNEDGYFNNDLDIIQSINQYVGSSNFIVKRHPRLSANRYKNLSIRTSTDSNIPWEVLILNENFGDKILYTVSSNACLTPALVFDLNVPIFYFRKALVGNISKTYKQKEFDIFLQKYKENYASDNFFEVSSISKLPLYYDKYFYFLQKKALREYLATTKQEGYI